MKVFFVNQRTTNRSFSVRRGAVLVELAFVLPLLFLLIFGMIELGRGIMMQQLLVNGAREGARTAVLPNATTTKVYSTIDTYMNNAGVTKFTRQVTPDPTLAAANTPITVTVSVLYDDVSWLPPGSLFWLSKRTMTGKQVMRKEP